MVKTKHNFYSYEINNLLQLHNGNKNYYNHILPVYFGSNVSKEV